MSVDVCLGCGYPYYCKTRDCGCPAGSGKARRLNDGRKRCKAEDCEPCRALDPIKIIIHAFPFTGSVDFK